MPTNRVTITLNSNGEIERICADEPILCYWVSPHTPDDRVYLYGGVHVGTPHVDSELDGAPIGHKGDGKLSDEERFGALSTLVSELRGRLGNLTERQSQDVGLWIMKACWLGEGKSLAEVFENMDQPAPRAAHLRLVKS